MTKATRTAEQFHEMLIERIEAIPDMAGHATNVHRGRVVGNNGDEGRSPN